MNSQGKNTGIRQLH